MFAYGRRWTSWVSVPSLSMRVTTPIGRPGGIQRRQAVGVGDRAARHDAVADVELRARRRVREQQVVRVARADGLDDAEDAAGGVTARAETPARVARARVGEERHLRRAAEDRRHAPDERLLVDDRLADPHAVARALVDADRRVPDGRRLRDDAPGLRAVVLQAERAVGLDELARAGRSRTARCRAARARARSWSRSARRSSTSPLASSVSPNQPNRSRTGLSARLAPSWIGLRTSLVPRWTACSAPPPDSPKYAVSRIREQTTSSPRTARRRRTVLSYTWVMTPSVVVVLPRA